jgi:hypothetical protein
VFTAYRHAIAYVLNSAEYGAAYAVRAAIPSIAPSDALTYIGQDRQIFQGTDEPESNYRARLRQWIDLWDHAGSSTAVLLGILSEVAPLTPQVQMVSTTSTGPGSPLQPSPFPITVWDTYLAGENPFPAGQSIPTPPDHYVTIPPRAFASNWDWDGSSLPYFYPSVCWRAWIIIQSLSNSPWQTPFAQWAPSSGHISVTTASDPTYGTVYVGTGGSGYSIYQFSWDDGTVWDWTGTPDEANALRLQAKEWKSAGCWIPWIIVSYNSVMFDETLSFGSNRLPDGNWGFWGKVVTDATYGTVYVPARPPNTTCSIIPGPTEGIDVCEAYTPAGVVQCVINGLG